MNILVSGSSGFIGSALMKSLHNAGHFCMRLVRSRTGADSIAIGWDPLAGRIDTSRMSEIDAVIHLAGENVASGRWTDEKKDAIFQSRVRDTKFLAQTLARLREPPPIFVCASATGFYGNRGDEILGESSPRGKGFLADVVWQWEAACEPAANKGIRVVNLRTGVVIGPNGGMLKRLLPIFRMGFGGKLGSGKQYMSWIALDDVIGAIHHALANNTLSGPVNLTSPNPVTNAEFTIALADALGRKAFYTVPAFALRLALGEMADEMLLASQRVSPKKLIESGYRFRYEKLEAALRNAIR